MATRNITAANSSISCACAIGNINFQGYSADSELSADTVKIVETRMGVDGQMSAGYVPAIKRFTVEFEASSSTIWHLMSLAQLTESAKTPQPVVMTITIPAVGKKFICSGFLTDYPPVLNIKRTLDPVSFGFDFQDIIPMSI